MALPPEILAIYSPCKVREGVGEYKKYDKPDKISAALGGVAKIYESEDKPIELEVRLRSKDTIPDRSGGLPSGSAFTHEAFYTTLRGYLSAVGEGPSSSTKPTLTRFITKAMTSGDTTTRRRDIVESIVDGNIVALGEPEIIKKKIRYTVEPDDRAIDAIGYTPRITLSDETETTPPDRWTKPRITSSIRVSVDVSDKWRMDATCTRVHIQREQDALVSDIDDFLFGGGFANVVTPDDLLKVLSTGIIGPLHLGGAAPFSRESSFDSFIHPNMAVRGKEDDTVSVASSKRRGVPERGPPIPFITAYNIEFEYLPHSGETRTVMKDIEWIINFIIKHGVKAKESEAYYRKQNMRDAKGKMLDFIKPLLREHYGDKFPSIAMRHDTALERGSLTMQQLLANPRSKGLSTLITIYRSIDKTPYYVTRKTDGVRSLIVIQCRKTDALIYIFQGSQSSVSPPVRLTADQMKLLKTDEECDTVIEAEYYNGTYYAYDILRICSQNLVLNVFRDRIAILEDGVSKKNRKFVELKNIAKSAGVSVVGKTYKKLTNKNFKEEVSKMFVTSEDDKKFDGVIMVGADEPYWTKNIYKFKPNELNSIDFLLKEIKPSSVVSYGIKVDSSKKIYIAYVSIDAKQRQYVPVKMARDNPWFSEHFPRLSLSSTDEGMKLPIPFATALIPTSFIVTDDSGEDYDDKIVECVWVETAPSGSSAPAGSAVPAGSAAPSASAASDPSNTMNGSWKPYRIHQEKQAEYKMGGQVYGNYYTIGLSVMSCALDPITPSLLEKIDTIEGEYFEIELGEKDPIYNDFRMFGAVTKAYEYERFAHDELTVDSTIVEVGGGHGGDIARMYYAGCRNLFLIDSDRNSLFSADGVAVGLLERMGATRELSNLFLKLPKSTAVEFNMRSLWHAIGTDPTDMLIDTMKADPLYPRNNITVVSMQFAVHYLCESAEKLGELKKLCDAVLRKNGILMLTFYDGARIMTLLDGGKKSYVKKVKDMVKYSIKPLFSVEEIPVASIKKKTLSDSVEISPTVGFGKKISIKLPTISSVDREEYLADPVAIRNVFNDYIPELDTIAMNIEEIDKKIQELHRSTIGIRNILSDEDSEYLGLIRIMILRKKKHIVE